MDYWWNNTIKIATKVPHNEPDLIIWNQGKVVCTVIDFSCPLYSNIAKKIVKKKINYGPFMLNMQIIYPNLFTLLLVAMFTYKMILKRT